MNFTHKLLASAALAATLFGVASEAMAQRKFSPQVQSNVFGRCLDRWDGVGEGNDVKAGSCMGNLNNIAFVVQEAPNGTHVIRSYDREGQTAGNLCLAPRYGDRPGSTIMMLACNLADPRMQWRQFDAGKEDGADVARFKFDKLCLDLEGGRSAAHRNPQGVVLWHCNGQENQNWFVSTLK